MTFLRSSKLLWIPLTCAGLVVAAAGLASPVIIIVGETVALAGSLDWFETPACSDAQRRSDTGRQT